MQTIIQTPAPQDLPVLAEMYYCIRKNEFHWETVIDVDDFYRDTKGEAILEAVVDGRIAGFISVWTETNFAHCLYIVAPYRRRGIGNKLIREAVRQFGAPLTLKCMKENTNALLFYEKNGWALEETIETDDGACCVLRLDREEKL